MNYDHKQRILKLFINQKEYFAIHLPVNLEILGIADRGNIFFHALRHPPRLVFDTSDALWLAIRDLKSTLQDIFVGKIDMHNNRISELGYLFNQELTRKDGKYYEIIDGRKKWFGWRYLLWSPACTPATWLFSANEIIYLLITPYYNRHMPKQKIPYTVFIRNYRDYLVRKINQTDAHNLFIQTNEIAWHMLQNTNKLRQAMGQYVTPFDLMPDGSIPTDW